MVDVTGLRPLRGAACTGLHPLHGAASAACRAGTSQRETCKLGGCRPPSGLRISPHLPLGLSKDGAISATERLDLAFWAAMQEILKASVDAVYAPCLMDDGQGSVNVCTAPTTEGWRGSPCTDNAGARAVTFHDHPMGTVLE